MASLDVSIVIVSFNTRQMTLRCLESLFQDTNGLAFEVIVFDNASSDGSADAVEKSFSEVRCIRSLLNIGFGPGNNEAIKIASGKYLLLLNPDTIVQNNAVATLHSFATTNPQAGAWGGVCILPNGKIDPGSRQVMPSLTRKFKNLFALANREVKKLDRSETFSGQVDVVSGAFMMLPLKLWRQLRGFDESFKLYSEETDLCRRIRNAGYPIMMSGSARIIHDTGSGDPNDAKRAVFWARGDMQFFRKHYSTPAALLAATLTWLHAFERLVCGYLLVPFIGSEKASSLRRRFSKIVFSPSQWWDGWKGQQL